MISNYNKSLEVSQINFKRLISNNKTKDTFFHREEDGKFFIKPAFSWALPNINEIIKI